MRTRIAAVVVVVLGLVSLVHGRAPQEDRGQLEGIVRDTSGAVLPGVVVDVSGPTKAQDITDSNGRFRFPSLLPGKYAVEASLPGFAPARLDVEVRSRTTARLAVQLQVGSVSETVTVTGESPRVNLRGLFRRPKPQPQQPAHAPLAALAAPPQVDRGPRRAPGGPHQTEAYDHLEENGFKHVSTDPLSTFSIDVDTASYANVRRILREGRLPDPGAVRVEELVNYFRLPYPEPEGRAPFAITTEVAECPWNPRHRLALIGIQGRELTRRDVQPRNLVFLLDVSGSMMPPDKLPLVQSALRLLVQALRDDDRVAIVTYAGSSGLALPSTPGSRKATISRAIAELQAGGSTNGAQGIQLAYRTARQHFIDGGVNRVILATDGDFNVGVTSQDALVRLIEQERESGVFLSVLGVGTGNLKDSTMEKLADRGNGTYAYLDSLQEARKVLVHELGGTLNTIAKDVKIQVEFNPLAVDGYRLIGYENRVMAHEDFNDDAKDAGDVGAGHSVTALYEIVPKGERTPGRPRDALKYQRDARAAPRARDDELMTVAVRFKAPDGDRSDRVEAVVPDLVHPMSDSFGFASAVAEFGLLLQESKHAAGASFGAVTHRARRYGENDRHGYHEEFIELVEAAARLSHASVDRDRHGH